MCASSSNFLVEAQAAVAVAADEVDDGEASVTSNGEGALTGRVQGEVVDSGVAVDGKRGKMDEAIRVKNGEGASGVDEDEVGERGDWEGRRRRGWSHKQSVSEWKIEKKREERAFENHALDPRILSRQFLCASRQNSKKEVKK
ncbi:hypothetical protein LR48_Vigan02g229400 [Vigna angularis]|uniref:Uncharacterized protein n=1 Tax=Phaseolus angularis TaxID=3914 RepID=A0A0L9U141_PHAAN|nr:hypothetical protein LR48_Vigan02g229400 [Vigna angularis]